MSDFNTSKIDGNTVGASEWNQLADVDNFVISSGQTPSTSNLEQLGIGSARYSSGGQFFTDSGTANAYVLTPVSPFKSPVSSGAGEGYFNGMIIRFRAGNANSGASTINVNSAGVKNLKKADGTDVVTGDILTTRDVAFRYDGTNFIKVENVNPATNTIQGISYINNRVKVVNDGTNPNDTIGFVAGTFITSSGIQIYLPTIRKKIQSTGSWTAGDTNNGLDTGARVANTFYRTFVIQNNTSGAYDILFSVSATSPTVPSGYTNLGIMDYALIRTNSSNIIAFSRWDANDKKLVLGASQQIVFVSSTAGSGNALIINTTEFLEFDVKLSISLTTTGFSDFAVYGNEQDGTISNDCLVVGTNNGFTAINNGLAYTNDGRIYWKNFNIVGGVSNQTGIIKAIKIRS
jgi:hypothetical protein